MKTIIRSLALVASVTLLGTQSGSAQFVGEGMLASEGLQSISASASLCDAVDNWGVTCSETCNKTCCRPRFAMFGEFLYLRARDAEVAYGVAIDGPIVPPPTSFPIQVGRIGVADHDAEAGFRVGGSYYLDDCSWVTGQFTRFHSSTDDSITTEAPNVIRSLVSHPGTQTAFQDFLDASAHSRINMDLVDLDYRHTWFRSPRLSMTYLSGTRYASLDQTFQSEFVTLGSEDVRTNVDFEGLGIRFGLEGEYCLRPRLRLYAKGAGSLSAGTIRANYFQGQTYDPSVVDTDWKAGRIVPIFDLETGASWVSASGRCRLSAGYIYSAWNNLVKTDQWIDSVRRNNFVDLGDDTITFDGLVARAEVRF